MFKKGDKIKITGDSVFKMMGYGNKVTGTAFTVGQDGKIIAFRCDQTGSIECYDDGKVEKVG